jgi:hypothetical protein
MPQGFPYCTECGHLQCSCPVDEFADALSLEAALQDEREHLRDLELDRIADMIDNGELEDPTASSFMDEEYDPDEDARLRAARDAYYGDLGIRRD